MTEPWRNCFDFVTIFFFENFYYFLGPIVNPGIEKILQEKVTRIRWSWWTMFVTKPTDHFPRNIDRHFVHKPSRLVRSGPILLKMCPILVTFNILCAAFLTFLFTLSVSVDGPGLHFLLVFWSVICFLYPFSFAIPYCVSQDLLLMFYLCILSFKLLFPCYDTNFRLYFSFISG